STTNSSSSKALVRSAPTTPLATTPSATKLRADLRNSTITIRHNRPGLGFPPVVYQDGERLGEAIKLDMVANDRRPNIEF
ncbi:MAG: hypothetical protein HC845_01910, partial [Akkermansiaceae bacterium]|nr:hypothetical protein [Akkermansiaceae bacterium]